MKQTGGGGLSQSLNKPPRRGSLLESLVYSNPDLQLDEARQIANALTSQHCYLAKLDHYKARSARWNRQNRERNGDRLRELAREAARRRRLNPNARAREVAAERIRRAASRESLNERKRKWRAANKETVRAAARSYRQRNRDWLIEKGRIRYAANRERLRAEARERARDSRRRHIGKSVWAEISNVED